jgi:VWFA-related protein
MKSGLLVAGLTVGCAILWGQEETVFRSAVSLVRIDAEVLDSAGSIVEGLKKEDFRLQDQGVGQPLSNVTFEQEPLDLILLFDLSGSMRGKLLGIVRAVELGFHELKTGDRVCVMTFSAGTAELLPFTDDLERANQVIFVRLPGLQFGGGSNTGQAAIDAAIRFRREPKSARRRAVLIVTDKAGSASPEAEAAVRSLWQNDVVLAELVLTGSKETRTDVRGSNPIAQRTGGSTVIAGDPGATFQRSVRLLRRRYTLYYNLPGGIAGSERGIQVQLSPEAAKRYPGATLRARTGYTVPAP